MTPYEQAALDWLLGANPWGVSMVIGYPHERPGSDLAPCVVNSSHGMGSDRGPILHDANCTPATVCIVQDTRLHPKLHNVEFRSETF
ncbi:MAG: hypothetical protein ACHQQP_04785 [Gemmatimonadales bacterium]